MHLSGRVFCRARPLYHHEQRSGSNENAAENGFHRHGFMQKNKGQNQRNDHAQLVNGNHFGCIRHLERLVVAQPRCAGGKAGQNQKKPAAFADLRNPALRIGEKHHHPRQEQNNAGPNGGRQIGIDAFDPDFG